MVFDLMARRKLKLLILALALVLSITYLLVKTVSQETLPRSKFSLPGTVAPLHQSNAIDGSHKSQTNTTVQNQHQILPDYSQVNVNYNVHIFYYPWYGTPIFDQQYYHWNHEYLPHWAKIPGEYDPTRNQRHIPPVDVASNFYPLLGAYSSRDPNVIRQHMKWILAGGIGVLVVSWYPPGIADGQGRPWDDLMPHLLDAANVQGLKIAFHLEPYPNRTAQSVKQNVEYILKKYGSHDAFYYYTDKQHGNNRRPLFYVYDSYLIPYEDWKQMLRAKSAQLSSTLFLGLLVKRTDERDLLDSGFDGFYTYFGTDGFSFGSSRSNWPNLSVFAKKNGLLSSISISPGYDDTRVRQWNTVNTRDRQNGEYYKSAWSAVLKTRPSIVSITSFNEWHEGTQIEPCISKADILNNYTYLNYDPFDPDYYLRITRINAERVG